jgi:hypothetical protein
MQKEENEHVEDESWQEKKVKKERERQRKL